MVSQHHFDVKVAEKVGVHAAVLLDNFNFWIAKNQADRKHIHDGKTWMYISKRGLAEYFPYLTERQIKYALSKLEENGMIQKGNFNKNPYDRTLWYTVTNVTPSTGQNCPMASDKIVRPIPDTNTDTDTPLCSPPEGEPKEKRSRKRFVPPTLEVLTAYCQSRGNSVDPEKFISYYESVGWKVGRNPMRDWKAAVRTWERKDAASQAKEEEPYRAPRFVGYDENGRGIYK